MVDVEIIHKAAFIIDSGVMIKNKKLTTIFSMLTFKATYNIIIT